MMGESAGASSSAQRSELLNLFKLLQHIVHRELAVHHSFGNSFAFLQIHFFLGSFNQGNNVSHTQDPVCHTVRIEQSHVLNLFAFTDEFYRYTGNLLDGENTAAS